MNEKWNDEYEFIKSFLKRPGMYVGANRLDYMLCFLSGFEISKVIIPNDNALLDLGSGLERWLLLKESVSIYSGNVGPQSLMERCYGNGKYACDKLKNYFEESRHNSNENVVEDSVSMHIRLICDEYQCAGIDSLRSILLSYSKCNNKSYYPLSQKIKDKIGEVEFTYDNIANQVKKMIVDDYDDLWIYLHYEPYFIQIRFLYQKPSKQWVENTSFVSSEDGYDNLVVLHAFAALAQKEEHKNHILTIHCVEKEVNIKVNEITDYSDVVFNRENKTAEMDVEPMYKLYEQWKKEIIEN